MQINIKKIDTAIFTNALVLPGVGYFILGDRLKGTIITFFTVLLLILPLAKYTVSVIRSMENMRVGSPAIVESLSSISMAWQTNQSFIIYCLIGIIALWAFCLIDLLLRKRRMVSEDD